MHLISWIDKRRLWVTSQIFQPVSGFSFYCQRHEDQKRLFCWRAQRLVTTKKAIMYMKHERKVTKYNVCNTKTQERRFLPTPMDVHIMKAQSIGVSSGAENNRWEGEVWLFCTAPQLLQNLQSSPTGWWHELTLQVQKDLATAHGNMNHYLHRKEWLGTAVLSSRRS